MTLKLNGSSSGYTAINAPAAAGSNTLVLPADNGSANEVLKTDGSGNLDWVAQPTAGNVKHTQLTGVDLNGNSSVEFAVPSNTFHLWLAIRDLSTASSSEKYLDLKVGGSYVTSGYKSTAGYIENGENPQLTVETNDGTWIFARSLAGASHTMTGIFDMKEFETNSWMHNWHSNLGNSGLIGISIGSIGLAGELQMIRVRADTGNFDDGRIVAHFLELV